MIDWYVLLVPLALLPIFLLFVFVGCLLDREGSGTPVAFGYQPGLDTDVQSFDAQFSADVTVEDGGSEFTVVPSVTRVNGGTPPLLAVGEEGIFAGFIDVESEGTVTCTCTITLKPPDDFTPAETLPPISSGPKEKVEDEDAPSFRLQRDGNGGFVVA